MDSEYTEHGYFVRRLPCHQGLIMEEVVIPPQGRVPLHYHPTGEVHTQKIETYYYLRGQGELIIGEKITKWPEVFAHISPEGGTDADPYPIPAGAIHGVRNTGTVPLVFLAIYQEPPPGVAFGTIFV